jgi:hypothetical protein
MLFVKFEGWFQCRLATDPDPVDEPRGVSGYMRALPGEPDFDRIIRFNDAPVKRDHVPDIGVKVTRVAIDGANDPNHPLLGARVDLMGDPKYYGYNGIVADDGVEAIVPFDLRIQKDGFLLQRAHADKEEFPFKDLLARNGIIPAHVDNAEATGIYDFSAYLSARADALKKELTGAEAKGDALRQDCLSRRIAFLASPSASQFFSFRMTWLVELKAGVSLKDPGTLLPRKLTADPWTAHLWMGAWDPDGLRGYAAGSLTANWAKN